MYMGVRGPLSAGERRLEAVWVQETGGASNLWRFSKAGILRDYSGRQGGRGRCVWKRGALKIAELGGSASSGHGSTGKLAETPGEAIHCRKAR